MTFWWIERVRDGEVEIVVDVSARGQFCERYMAAVHACQPSDGYRLCRSNPGGEREVVDEYTPPAKASEPDSTSEASDGEWQPGPWRTNDGRPCVILEVHDFGKVSWAYRSLDGPSWYVHTAVPDSSPTHPAPPVCEVVQRHHADLGGVYCCPHSKGTLVRWTIRGGKIVEAEVLEGEQ